MWTPLSGRGRPFVHGKDARVVSCNYPIGQSPQPNQHRQDTSTIPTRVLALRRTMMATPQSPRLDRRLSPTFDPPSPRVNVLICRQIGAKSVSANAPARAIPTVSRLPAATTSPFKSLAMTTRTSIRLSGTAISFNPALSTPYPQGPECALTYRRPDGKILAWDVVYGLSFSSEARTCHPPEVTDWWFQTESTATYTAFGPTFECPEQYEAVQTAVVSDDNADVQQVFCCPSYVRAQHSPRPTRDAPANTRSRSFSLHVAQPLTKAFPSQCITTATSGQVLSFLDVKNPDESMASAMTTSTVDDDEVTIFGQPVNGFNHVKETADSEGPNGDGWDNGGDKGTPLAVSVGVSVGVVVGLVLIGLGAWLLWRRRRRLREVTPALESEDSGALDHGGMREQAGAKPAQELAAYRAGAELEGDGCRHELPT